MTERDRVGAFLTRSIPRRVERAGCTWPVRVWWDDRGAYCSATRGDLVLVSKWVRWPAWWSPPEKWKAKELAGNLSGLLVALWRQYGEVDPSGRIGILASRRGARDHRE